MNCGAETTNLHEIFFGRGNKQICVENHIQVPLCEGDATNCHLKPHEQHKENEYSQDVWKEHFCIWLGIDREKAEQAVQYKHQRQYLFEVKDKCLKKLHRSIKQ
jgi:hypothetical protein